MENERYIRQTILKGFGLESQKKLTNASVLVVGAGGLGVPVLQYLNAMGVGKIGLIDNDVVSLSNLHRQVLYSEKDIDKSKIVSAIEKLKAQNSNTDLIGYESFLTKDNAISIIGDYDLVVDASDNFSTRYLVNDVCVMLGKPFIYGALHSFEGYLSVFNYKEGPTYRCLYPTMPKAEEIPNCNEQGVLGVIPGIIGNLQALEAVKIITGIGTVLSGKLLIFNGLEQEYHKFNICSIPKNKIITALQDSYELECNIDTSSLTANAFSELLDSNDQLQLIDVRTEEEYQDFHLKQGIHIPLDSLDLNHNTINYNKPVYFICQSGVRSVKAIQILRKHQPKATLINIEGGLNQLRDYASGH
jgi:molybdopterin/thiamine biosynthesis adenylyltransferase/rhodanese-related sulfurtransferase